jgi:integrase
MPKVKEPLTDKKIKAEIKKDAKTISDGSVSGLALYKTKTSIKINNKEIPKYVWRLRYTYGGKRSYYSIGEYPTIGLKEAREMTREAKKLLEKGIDPNEYKRKRKEELIRLQNRKKIVDLIEEYLEIKKQNVSETRYKKNYVGTFKNYVIPFIGNRYIDDIDKNTIVNLIKKVPKIKLKKATRTSNKTYKAKDVLNIIKDMFEFAVDNDYLEYNPALSVKIDKILPKHQEKHITAVTDENKIKEIYNMILQMDNQAASKILQFQALTALRNGNIRNLKWDYINWNKRVIVFPKESMKAAHSDYRLPLTDTLIKILKYFEQFSKDKEYVFISLQTNKQISENFLNYHYKKLGLKDIHSPHGWRSAFRTIAAEKYKEHKFPFEVIEAQLHHKIGNKVTQAYLRTDFLEERFKLLEWWENFLSDMI